MTSEKKPSRYPVAICFIEEPEGEGYYLAFLPDFGWATCGAPGNTPAEALANLARVESIVTAYYKEQGEPLPAPSTFNPDGSGWAAWKSRIDAGRHE